MSVATASQASVFGHRAFAYYWIGRIVSILSFQMLMVAIGWQLYSITGSALDLGFLGLAQFVPMLVLTLLVGHIADRCDYRAILLVCQSGEALAAAFLAAGSLMGWLDPWAIYAVTALVGAARAFEIPTMVAIIPALVPRPLVPAATAWFTSASQAGQIIGPVLGGLLYAFGPAAVYGTAIALWAVGASFIAMIKMERPPRSAEPLTLRSALGGFQFVMRDRVILGTIALDMCAVFLAGLGTLFPIFARDILKTEAWGLGLLRAAPAVGALIMSVVLARRPLTLPIGQVLFGVIAVFGLFTILFGLSTHLILSLAALAVLGAADAVSVVIRFSLVQLRTPPQMRGRVSAVNGMFTGTSNYLGDFRAGAVAALLGAPLAAIVGGAGVFAVLALWLFLFPQLRRIRSLDEVPQVSIQAGAGPGKP
ncbi:MAG: MFS transporter [Xanthobacteraceae bacterium]|nr:MFS transporter [Xanthobacteraceae bacterium]